MTSRLDEVLTEDERLDLWCEIQVLAHAMLEMCDWWWELDPGLSSCTDRRAGIRSSDSESPDASDVSDS
jgi:hypothetical protein